MSIKPDHWIRKMATEHGMLEPFVDKQVRDGVVSYGLSSYGYDIRVADEFLVFTAGLGDLTIVDPKHFDERSMVPFKGPVCVVPPNSFVLARTVEYFRIPRNILTICLGKCLTGDTRVVDADTGAYLPISQFAAGSTLGIAAWELGRQPVSNMVPQGTQPVFLLTTRLGLQIKATARHPFMQLHGWTPLADLRPGDRIAAARSAPIFGTRQLPTWEAALLGMMISEGQCSTPGHSPTFTTADPVMAEALERSAKEGLGMAVTHNGAMGYRLVNRSGRGGVMLRNRATAWLESYGLAVHAGDKFVPQAVFTAPAPAVRTFLQALFSGDGSIHGDEVSMFLEYYSMSRRLIEDIHHLLLRFGIVSMIRSKKTQIGTTAHRIQITDREEILKFAERIGFWPGSIKQRRLEAEFLPSLRARGRGRSNFDTLPPEAWPLLRDAAAHSSRSLRSMGIERTTPSQSLPRNVATLIAEMTEHTELASLTSDGPVWDTVVSITPAGIEETYDLSVPGAHNFLANDLIVHNSTYARCGVIVNVTPFEPEWEGYATLEISNTTPLPARIYANEGIAQVLFFEGDPPLQSYADKKGKYQKQVGITLPKL